MADKKITALSERLVPIIGEDLLLLVANVVPASLAANYKVQVKNFLTNCAISFPADASSAAFRITGNVVANVNSSFMVTAADFRLDTGNTTASAVAAYGVVIEHTVANNSYTRGNAPVAYLGLVENAGANGQFKTSYLLEAGLGGADVGADLSAANANVLLSKTADKVATHTLKIRVNGVDYYLLASNTAPA